MRKLIKKLIPKTWRNAYWNRHLETDNYYMIEKKHIRYAHDLLFTYHNADFVQEPKFKEAYRICKDLGGELLKNYDIEWRIHVLCWAASQACKLKGDFVDCGVYTGFCARAVIHYVDFEKTGKQYFLFDTFSGLDPRFSSPYEMRRNTQLGYGKNAALYDQVVKTFSPFHVRVVKGAIPESLNEVKISEVSFLSIDMNAVLPEREALEYFWPLMTKGGIIILDDYGYPGCEEQKKTHDAFAVSKGVQILSLPTCQGLIIQP